MSTPTPQSSSSGRQQSTSVTLPGEPKLDFATTWGSVLMDLVRGLAALLVLLQHWRNLLFVDYSALPHHPLWISGFYLICSAGHQAVVIFFVLSGFLISRSIFNRFQSGAWSWRLYLSHRLLRLWIVLLPGLLLCALWDQIGLHSNLAPALYGGAFYNHIILPIAPLHTPAIFFSNLFFLQGIRTPPFGSDLILWSLSYEFWYYVLFPLGVIALRPRTTLPMRLFTIAAFFLLAASLIHTPIPAMAPVWLVGTVLAITPPPRVSNRVRILATCAYLPILFAAAVTRRIPSSRSDLLLAAATYLLLWVLLSARSHASRSLPAVRASRQLARFSYTMYVAHVPFLLLLTAWFVHDTRWIPTPAHILFAFALLALTLAYSYGLASITEFHTARVRRWVDRKLGRQPTSPKLHSLA